MILRRFVVPVIASSLVVGVACSSPPPPPPAPTVNQDSVDAARRADSLRQAQADSARARAARAEEERRQRDLAAQRARDAAIAAARTTLQERVHFDYDMSEIRADAAERLRAKVGILRASPQVRLRIEGHADERGSTEYNLALGNRRAESVRQFLAGFGLAQNRFEIVSFGEERPAVRQSNETAWAQNRRAEFVITAGANSINPPGN